MKVVNIIGGLGNQMFQYAFAIALKQEFSQEKIKINTKCFRGYPLHNGYELPELFKLDIPECSFKELSLVAYPWGHYRLWQVGRRILPFKNCMVDDRNFKQEFSFDSIASKKYFDGYWQSPKFFAKYKKAIQHTFTFSDIEDAKNLEIVNFINTAKTAFVHVRRGDYIDHPVFGGICTLDYYETAIEFLKKKYNYSRFIVFSNDPDWTKENLCDVFANSCIKYVDWNRGKNSFRDMQLMSMCRAGIIANSSFSWWGAWLGEMEVVICPAKWTNILGHHEDIIPTDWIRINHTSVQTP